MMHLGTIAAGGTDVTPVGAAVTLQSHILTLAQAATRHLFAVVTHGAVDVTATRCKRSRHNRVWKQAVLSGLRHV